MINQFKGRNVLVNKDQEILAHWGLAGGAEWAYLGYNAVFFLPFFAIAWAGFAFGRHHMR